LVFPENIFAFTFHKNTAMQSVLYLLRSVCVPKSGFFKIILIFLFV
jgi:hypothetical protein